MNADFTMDSGDIGEDVRFTDRNCYYFLFPVTGGRLSKEGALQTLIGAPKVSSRKICIASCNAGGQTVSLPSILILTNFFPDVLLKHVQLNQQYIYKDCISHSLSTKIGHLQTPPAFNLNFN